MDEQSSSRSNATNPSGPEPLDLSKPGKEQRPSLERADAYSPFWVSTVWPIARSLLALIAAAMLVPFLMIALLDSSEEAIEPMIDWAKTILAPVVGFGGAIVGYYFGTRSDGPVGELDEAERDD